MMFEQETKLPTRRIALVQYTILAMFLVLIYGFWQLQVLQQDRYQALADSNRIRTEPILAPRGRIVDREGRLIVDNYPSFNAYIIRDQAKEHLGADLKAIAHGLTLDPEDIQDRIAKYADAPAYQQIVIKEDITPAELAFIDSHRDEYPELGAMPLSRRLYPPHGFLAHVVGYVGEAGDKEIEQMHLHPGAIVGKFGLEQYYNDYLMGKDGERRVVVDSHGRVVGELNDTPSQPGHTLRLTVDNDLQLVAEQALGDRPGAVVALDPRTGEILAMASRPVFDPNEFAMRLRPEQWNRLLNDPERPLLNKTIQAQLAPGSTFKIIMSVAGLQENVAQNRIVICNGGAEYYGRFYGCWIREQHKVHGPVGIRKAISESCDVFFYSLGMDLGIERIAKYASALGLGVRTGVDLPHEAPGLVPSPEWKERRFHQEWWKGETISVSIGQGATTVTPLQLARTVGGISEGGIFRRPHLVFPGEVSGSYPRDKFQAEFRYPVRTDVLSTIADGMRGSVQPGGTASSAQLVGIDFGGKTGSAQTISNEGLKHARSRREFVDNAWFVGLYPVRNAEIAVCVLYERGGHGQFAARVAAPIIQAYYDKKMGKKQQTEVAAFNSAPARPTADAKKAATRASAQSRRPTHLLAMVAGEDRR